MEKAKISKIDDFTYCFTEDAMGVEVYMYLLVGDEKVLLIDTAYGFTDVPEAIKNITELPLIVANTHAHLDHVHGNHMYPEVFFSKKDEALFRLHTDYDYCKKLYMQIAQQNGMSDEQIFSEKMKLEKAARACLSRYRNFPPEMYFELGNRKVFIIETPGHTEGSVCFLDKRTGWLFSGDTGCRDGVLLNLEGSTTVQTFYQTICGLQTLVAAGEISMLYPAHQVKPLETDILDYYARGCEDILKGEISEEELTKGLYVYNKTAIAFQKEKIR